ncbi:MAG: RNA polymerase sigma factor [Bacteroidales bacterium]|nr:RNA polymerase sigma factor [Bacteroidales bacterium]
MTESLFHKDYLPLAETLYRIAYYMLESEVEAEDAVQELYLRLWEFRDSLDGIRLPKAYAIRLLKNLCIDRIRKASHETFPEELPQTGFSPAPDDTFDAKARLNKVLEAVKALPERQRKVLILRTVDGLSYEEIAERTGMNYLTCRVLLSQARSIIKHKV